MRPQPDKEVIGGLHLLSVTLVHSCDRHEPGGMGTGEDLGNHTTKILNAES